ncbi:hypothetical protein [Pseudanabaena sp. FACHB-2040]|uniref:hypothetical protein n=1 Tax=Pseudanabaena sp. FACHB-2040 TaxID=2692859 RepID=UPI001687F809|nr:hypothetical protein [Pseudanabaena sp. FACHB-2040]MBD2259764.1 hypothetical protein [Pseudanabaena sp. FACHB-2040]
MGRLTQSLLPSRWLARRGLLGALLCLAAAGGSYSNPAATAALEKPLQAVSEPLSQTAALENSAVPNNQPEERPSPTERFAGSRRRELLKGVQRGAQAFWAEVQWSGFIALTGVEPRAQIDLLEGATFLKQAEGTTFVLSNGTTVPPLSAAAYSAVQNALPPNQQGVLDDKFFWLLQRNPALPLITQGLQQGKYLQFLEAGRFNTDAYYREVFFPQLFAAAATAGVEMAAVLPLVEVHLVTLSDAFFQQMELEQSGTVHSFHKYELALTNQQYLLRTFLGTPLETQAKLEAIKRVEQTEIKADYTESPTTSTTIVLGRLPLPTPTAAEDTPGVHALSIAHLREQGISLFSPEVEQAATDYQVRLRQQHRWEHQHLAQIEALTAHYPAILAAIDQFEDNRFWHRIGFTDRLDRRSVAQLDTTRLLGIYATRHEGVAKGLLAASSYPLARADVIRFFRDNSAGLGEQERLQLFLSDQALNAQLWQVLERKVPQLRPEIRTIQANLTQLNQSYQQTTAAEAQFFRVLQAHNLDISTDAFTLLTVALAKRLSDLAEAQFKPIDRQDLQYLQFVRGLMPFLRDMPDMNTHWGDGSWIKKYGQNYLVPDLMALTPEEAPVLSAIGQLHFKMVSQNDLNLWDFATLVQVMATSFNLSVGYSPAALSAEQVALLPLVNKYRSELKRIAGADGLVGTNALHGLGLQDYRIASWPSSRSPIELAPPAADSPIRGLILPPIVSEKDPVKLLLYGGPEVTLSKDLVLQHSPEFTTRADGSLDLSFTLEGNRLTIPAFSKHFKAVYSPAYMTRINLPPYAGAAYAEALNQVIQRSHALYGGYTLRDMSLPEPLEVVP